MKRMKTKKQYRHFRDANPKARVALKERGTKARVHQAKEYQLKHAKDPQKLFLTLLLARYGGSRAVAKLLDVPAYSVVNWCAIGVPVKHLSKVAQTLRVKPWALNYEFHRRNMGMFPDLPTWKECVKLYKLTPDEVKAILKLGDPK